MHFLFLLIALSAGILQKTGIRFNPNGYNIDIIKLINESVINISCVLL